MNTGFSPVEQEKLLNGLGLALANLIIFTTLVLFFCIVSNISIAVPSILLAVYGLGLLILGRLRLFSFYGLAGLLFISYIFLQFIVYPARFSIVQALCFPFFGGFALYFSAEKRQEAFENFTRYLPGVFLLSVLLLFPWLALSGPLSELFRAGRLIWVLDHHNDLGFLSSTVVLAGCCFLFDKSARRKPGPDRQTLRAAWQGLAQERPLPRLVGGFNLAANHIFGLFAHPAVVIAGVLVAFVFIILCASRSSLFGCTAVAALFWGKGIWREKRLRKFILLAFAGLALLYLLLFIFFPSNAYLPGHTPERMIKVFTDPTGDATFQSRRPVWESAWDGFSKHPLTGQGLDSFTDQHREYTLAHIARFKNQLGRGTVFYDTLILTHAHNQWLMLLAETGIIGTALFATLFLLPLGYGVIKRRSLGLGVPLLLYYSFVMAFEAPLYTPHTGCILLLLFGFYACCRANARAKKAGNKVPAENETITTAPPA